MSIKTEQTQSTLTPEVAADVCAFFALGNPQTIAPISIGNSHNSYFVETDESDTTYVVRVLGYVNRGVLANEVHLQQQMQEVGVSTPVMVAGQDGQALYRSESVAATVTAKLPGSHPLHATEKDCFLTGQVLGKFHNAAADLPYQSRATLLGQGRIAQSIDAVPHAEQRKQLMQLFEASSTLYDVLLPEGVLHGDIHARNLLIEGDQASVLDFESAGHNLLLLDLGRAAADLCRDEKGWPDPAKTTGLIDGYETERRLTSTELALLPQAIVYGHVAVASWLLANGFANDGALHLDYGLRAA